MANIDGVKAAVQSAIRQEEGALAKGFTGYEYVQESNGLLHEALADLNSAIGKLAAAQEKSTDAGVVFNSASDEAREATATLVGAIITTKNKDGAQALGLFRESSDYFGSRQAFSDRVRRTAEALQGAVSSCVTTFTPQAEGIAQEIGDMQTAGSLAAGTVLAPAERFLEAL